MDIQPLVDWQEYVKEGHQYFKTAVNGIKRPEVFTPELVYQITAMAIEKMLVGLSQFHRQMPGDHTLEGLVEGLDQICPLEAHLAEQVKALGRLDNMCLLEPVNRLIPDDREISAMLETASQVEVFVLNQVGGLGQGEP